MKRIDTATRQLDKHGVGKDGFRDANPGAGTPATQLNATLFDHLQEELAAIVEGGGVALNPAVFNQVFSTLEARYARMVGAVVHFATLSAPPGWLKCNGALLSRSAYSALWSVAQTSGMLTASDAVWTGGEFGKFSPGDGAATFRIPDLRGEFLRAWDDARGVDAARALGTRQTDEIKSHNHESNTYTGAGSFNVAATPGAFAGSYTGSTGGVETRPRNVALLACIKY